ncbi:ATP-binding protein [Paraburkholderia terrae]
MNTNETPWVSRFTALMNLDVIRTRVELRPEPIRNIRGMPMLEACQCVKKAIERMFYPSAQCLGILLEWLSVARAHSLEMYENQRVFLQGVYQHESPLPEFFLPWCLTGLAGVGKSTLVRALARLVPEPATLIADDGTQFPLVSYRAITVRASSTSRDILTQFAQCEGKVRDLTARLRRMAYRDGWGLVLQDEFQFATQSENASTRVAQMILAMCYIGVPPIYAANFSLLHKLNSRSQEERHRLLGQVHILLPDDRDSDDWRTLLKRYRDVAPDVFTFDPNGDAAAIHTLTAAVKRHVVELLTIGLAFALAEGTTVDYSTLEKAYKSRAYATFRDDVEALAKLYGPFRNRRKDLWCPIDGVVTPTVDRHLQQQRQMRADEKALDSSMTVKERKVRAALSEKPTTSGVKPNKATVASIRAKKADAERLRENNAWFSEKA